MFAIVQRFIRYDLSEYKSVFFNRYTGRNVLLFSRGWMVLVSNTGLLQNLYQIDSV
jgi:hypothetical protein